MFKNIKRFFFIFLSLSCFSVGFASDIKSLVFLGDSLSDNGNLYRVTKLLPLPRHGIPSTENYFEGRFSNGKVWSDWAAEDFVANNGNTSENYAVGGSTILLINPFNKYLPWWNLRREIYLYFVNSHAVPIESTLFSVWSGSNDYINITHDPDSYTKEVIDTLREDLEYLIHRGAKSIMVINLPDFSLTPFGRTPEAPDHLSAMATIHNLKLVNLVTDLTYQYKSINIKIFDVNALFADTMNNPDVYNKKYHVNITDVTTSCWTGGYTLKANPINAAIIAEDFKNELRKHALKNVKDEKVTINPDDFSKVVFSSPALLEAYRVSYGKEQQCANPDEHMFWDKLHPSRIVHKILSYKIEDFIKQNYKVSK